MRHWNYRVFEKNGVYSIHEVYYSEDEKVEAWSEDSIRPEGGSLEELTGDLAHMALALGKPVLREEELK